MSARTAKKMTLSSLRPCAFLPPCLLLPSLRPCQISISCRSLLPSDKALQCYRLPTECRSEQEYAYAHRAATTSPAAHRRAVARFESLLRNACADWLARPAGRGDCVGEAVVEDLLEPPGDRPNTLLRHDEDRAMGIELDAFPLKVAGLPALSDCRAPSVGAVGTLKASAPLPSANGIWGGLGGRNSGKMSAFDVRWAVCTPAWGMPALGRGRLSRPCHPSSKDLGRKFVSLLE